ncbi:MAG: SIMPL domain-containing protein [Propionibacteriaceae bacterium]|jgi:uncharacterized protein YggE|nr:SIMPL domain-containing protein [Propionibacteriaceae bacterium]
MPPTDIIVTGQARDLRAPDRALLRVHVSKTGRDWASTHHKVTLAVAGVTEAIKQLQLDHPQAIYEHSISQVSQRSWTDDSGAVFSEAVDIAVVFVDFAVMSDWIFNQTSEVVAAESVQWQLSPAARNELRISLSVEAVRDARRKAETLALAAGLTITGIKTITDPGWTDQAPAGPMMRAMIAGVNADDSQAIDITPSSIETAVRVDIAYLADVETTVDPYPTSLLH